MLTAAVAGPGRYFGWQPAAKVSMMIIRPPQQRQGRGSTWGSSAAAVVSACFEQDGTFSSSRARANVGGAIAVGEQSVVADAVQALGQYVHEETSNELVGWQRHGLVPARPFDAVILPREGDTGRVGGDQPAIGDGNAVGVARQVGEHGPRPGERLLGVDHPLGLAQRREERREGGRLGEHGVVAEEREASSLVSSEELAQEQSSEQA